MNRFNLPQTILTIIILAFPVIALAQDPGGGPDAPIDGGLSVLLAAGAAYGVKKYRDYKKSSGGNSEQSEK